MGNSSRKFKLEETRSSTHSLVSVGLPKWCVDRDSAIMFVGWLRPLTVIELGRWVLDCGVFVSGVLRRPGLSFRRFRKRLVIDQR